MLGHPFDTVKVSVGEAPKEGKMAPEPKGRLPRGQGLADRLHPASAAPRASGSVRPSPPGAATDPEHLPRHHRLYGQDLPP